MLDCARAILLHPNRFIFDILGTPDDLKLCSCMTLFHLADPAQPLFSDVLRVFYDGRLDAKTIRLLRSQRDSSLNISDSLG
jgi:uncharacterized protein (DUF1810 family)